MATFQNTVTIARPADEVFAFLADFGNIRRGSRAPSKPRPGQPGYRALGPR